MRKTILLLPLIIFSIISSFSLAQDSSENSITHYKITFPEIDQFQLKTLVPTCENIFQSKVINKGDAQILYFNSPIKVSENKIKTALKENNFDYKFILEVVDD